MVSVELIKRVLAEWEEELERKFREERIVEREVSASLRSLLSTDVALVITGVRRCGKSILAYSLARARKAGYVNFEDERLELSGRELNKVLEAMYSLKGDVDLLVLDEIQNVAGWERFVSRLLLGRKVIITGSNARLLSGELSTFLTGRHIDFLLFPFSFREYLSFVDYRANVLKTRDIARIKELLEDYIYNGGFPLTHKLGRIFLSQNFRDIVERDVLQRYRVRYPSALKRLARFLVANSGNEISLNRLRADLSIGSPLTVLKYTEFLENAYLVFLVERFSFRLRRPALAPKKVYSIDTGITSSLLPIRGEGLGRLIETLVAIELMRRKSYWFQEWEINYWKDHQRREVDFVVRKGNRVLELIQVTYASDISDVRAREVDALIRASEALNCRNLKIITWDLEDTMIKLGRKIKLIPLWKWLLQTPDRRYAP